MLFAASACWWCLSRGLSNARKKKVSAKQGVMIGVDGDSCRDVQQGLLEGLLPFPRASPALPQLAWTAPSKPPLRPLQATRPASQAPPLHVRLVLALSFHHLL